MREGRRTACALLEVGALRVVARVSLRLLSLDRAAGVSVAVAGLGSSALMPAELALGEVELATERWMPGEGRLGAKCLERALVRLAMLRRRGVPADMCIGVTILGGKVSAHAWNTLDARVLFGDTEHARVRRIWDSCRVLDGGGAVRGGPSPVGSPGVEMFASGGGEDE